MARRSPIETEEQAYELSVRLLSRMARSSREVSDHLSSRGASPSVIDSVLGRLKSHRHLDDAALAEDQAFSLIEGSALAPTAAILAIVSRGVAEAVAREAVAAAVDGRSELDLALRSLERRLKGRRLTASQSAREARALVRAGFDEDVVMRAVERLMRTE